jgi:DNA-binding CsgD family transcriptional regulator
MRTSTHIDQVTFSDKEQLIGYLLCLGISKKEIAAELGIGTRTVTTHIERVSKPLGLKSIGQLVHFIFANSECLGGFPVPASTHPHGCKCGEGICHLLRHGRRIGLVGPKD